MTDVDVVVCGAGVGGLAAAHTLSRSGLDVLLLDRRAEPADVPKGELLQPESVQILDQLGALPALHAGGAVGVDRLAIRDPAGRMLLPVAYTDLPGAYRQILCTGYRSVLDALAGVLPGTVTVRRGVLVTGVRRTPDGRVDGVTVRDGGTDREITARLVVAADGVSSKLREAVGLDLHRRPYDHRLVAFDVAAPPVDAEVCAYLTDRGLRLVYPLPGGRSRVYVQIRPDDLRDGTMADLDGWCDGLLAEVPALGPLAGPLRDSLPTRQALTVHRLRAPRLTVPGLALVGEAAHAVHPMAAQGINSSLADAWTLGERIAAAGPDPAGLDAALDDYQRTRLARLDHTATVSHNAARMLTTTGGLARLLGRRMMRHTAGNRRLLRLTAGNLAGVDLRPLRPVDRLYQFGLLTDRRADAVGTQPTMNEGATS
ncbi:FAD-dependent oxidoreductase [Micromonospora echinofusca]|uniref:FAD-binding protein n=1 Tax=Micromonospora echinofusca TaxID=47858 RepID=A0ABS3VS37_MICEH|nr:NAD(P)/FAD-dependent oxidoreductase [Micromonospora echinofusca]MBO4207338.1 FAD-binding protein [Micromonospora echinofusca]